MEAAPPGQRRAAARAVRLDLACGTGDLAWLAAGGGAHVMAWISLFESSSLDARKAPSTARDARVPARVSRIPGGSTSALPGPRRVIRPRHNHHGLRTCRTSRLPSARLHACSGPVAFSRRSTPTGRPIRIVRRAYHAYLTLAGSALGGAPTGILRQDPYIPSLFSAIPARPRWSSKASEFTSLVPASARYFDGRSTSEASGPEGASLEERLEPRSEQIEEPLVRQLGNGAVPT